jgi:hypothetical protein
MSDGSTDLGHGLAAHGVDRAQLGGEQTVGVAAGGNSHDNGGALEPDRGNTIAKPRKSRQGDLFTGEFNVNPPKRGNGHHIKLAVAEGEPAKAIGMAHFPGTGPERTYCRECKYCQDIDVWRGGRYRAPSGKSNPLPIRTQRNACWKAAKLLDGIVQRGGIGANPSCKYFESNVVKFPRSG